MLNRVRNVVAHAHPAGVSSRHAHSRAECRRTCLRCRSVVAPCSIACGMLSRRPTLLECRRSMLNRGWNASVHAHGAELSSRQAHSRLERDRAPSRATQHGAVADAATRRVNRADFESWLRLDCRFALQCGAAKLDRWAATHQRHTNLNIPYVNQRGFAMSALFAYNTSRAGRLRQG
jgi:hypothetical protein